MAISRRNLVKLMGLAAASGATLPSGLAQAAGKPRIVVWRNWSGSQTCIPSSRIAPHSEAELAELLRTATGVVRPVGAAHSFQALVPTDGTIVSLTNMAGMICYSSAAQTADFWAGTRLTDMGDPLFAAGQALVNMPDIDYQALGGAIATSTHGTGATMGSLSAYVKALTLVTPAGDILQCDAENNADIFHAARCSMGALGVITRFTMQNRPTYKLKETQWLQRTDELLEGMDEFVANNRHFELMPIIHSDISLAISLNETDEEPSTEKAEEEGGYIDLLKMVDKYIRDYPNLRASIMNMVGGMVEFDSKVDWSYKVFANERTVRFNEMEYQVPAEAGPDCLREILTTIRERKLNSWFPLEYRYVKADDIWLSQFQGRDACSISVHQYYEQDYKNYFARIEPIFWKYGGRPHWGKLHTLNHNQLKQLYPHWQDFLEVRESLDPAGRMLNGHLRSLFGVHGSAQT